MGMRPPIDQFKVLRSEFKEVKLEIYSLDGAIRKIDTKVKMFEVDLDDFRKEVNKSFEELDQKLFEWKSEIHNIIDKGYTTRWKNQEVEHAAIQSRLEEHQEDIDKVKSKLRMSVV